MEKKMTTMVPTENLTPNPTNFYVSTDKDVLGMAASLRDEGVKVPITVMKDPANPDHYIIISGHLRVLGCELARIKEVPVIIEEYASEEDELNALLLGNEYRTKTKREIATEMSLRKKIWAKKQGARTDLYNEDGEVTKSTRTRLAERYKMSESNVGKYEAILEKRPDLFKLIDDEEMSIDGASKLIPYLEEHELLKLDELEMWTAVVNQVSPHLIQRVNEGRLPLILAFLGAVKNIGKLKKPKVRKEGEEGNADISPAKKATPPAKSQGNDASDEVDENEAPDAKPEKAKKATRSEEVEVSRTAHRCELPECPCYGQLVQVMPEEDADETQSAA